MPRWPKRRRQRFDRLGYDNIEVRVGDGTKGWPDAAPFDAILVAAGGPGAPQALKEQLDVGGRLVIPVGDEPHDQRLLKITRTGAATYEEEDLGGVAVRAADRRAGLGGGRKPLGEQPSVPDTHARAACRR